MASKRRGSFLSYQYRPYLIVFIYLIISVLWIFFSDRAVSSLFIDPKVITAIQTYKGLAFVSISALLLFSLIRVSIHNVIRSEERFRSTLGGMLEGCQIIGLDWRYRYLNSTAVTHSRKAEDDLIGHTMMEVYPGIESTYLFSTLRDCMEKRIPKRMENLFSFPDGSEGWFELSIEPVPEGLFILSLDISERKRAEAALHESEERYRTLIENSDDAIFLTSPEDGAIYQANPAACRMFGYSEAELVQIGREGIIDPADPRLEPALQKRKRTRTFRGELSFRRRDGRVFPCEITSAVFTDKNGDRKTSMIIRDVTQRTLDEQRIMHLNAVLRALRGINRLITREKDRRALISKSCELLVQTRGYPVAWILLLDDRGNYGMAASAGAGENITTFLEQITQGIRPPCVRRAMEQEYPLALFTDVKEQHGDCALAPYHVGGAGLVCRLEHGGKIYGSITVDLPVELATDAEEQELFSELAGDIAFALASMEKEEQHIQWQNDLRRSEEKLRHMFEALNEGIIVIGLDNTILEINDAILRMYGKKARKDLLGKSVLQFIADYDRDRVRQNISSTLTAQTGRVVEYVLLRGDGSEFPAEMSVAALRDAEGNPTGVIAVVEDITERKRMEEQMLITDRLASIGELASGIAHELNNPLTGIIGLSELLLKADVPQEAREDIEMIHSESLRTSKIVRNLLTFARRHTMETDAVDVGEVVKSALELRAYELKVNNIETDLRFAPSLPKVKADAFQLQQVFLNIVINAEYFMIRTHGRGKLIISTESAHGAVRITFSDDGPGIPEHYLKHIFDPFFTTKEVGQGTGLGLSICHGIVTGQGGTISAKNKQDGGAVFIIEFPAAPQNSTGTG